MFIKVKDLKEMLNTAPDDAYIVLYDNEAEEDTFLEQFDVREASEGSGYCQGDSMVDIAIEEGEMPPEETIVVLSGSKHWFKK